MLQTKIIGLRGESIAKKYLENNAYKIIAQNHRIGRFEIDIIAARLQKIIFFEIKTRFQNKIDKQQIPLTRHQVINLKQAMNNYCYTNSLSLTRVYLDLIVISVNRATQLASLRHYRNIF